MKIMSFAGNIFPSLSSGRTVDKGNKPVENMTYPNLSPLSRDTITINSPTNKPDIDTESLILATSIINKKCEEHVNSHFRNVELFKNMSYDDLTRINDFFKTVGPTSIMSFATGNKPVLLSSSVRATTISKFQSDKVDVLQIPNEKNENNDVYLINKKYAKNIIKDNIELFTKRMNLPQDTSVDDIYNKLWDDDSPLNQENYKNDLAGLLLGYPKLSSIIYNLEHEIDTTDNFRTYSTPKQYKEHLTRILESDNSPYKDMNKDFKQEVKEAINRIGEIKHSRKALFGSMNKEYNTGYDFIYFTEEPLELNRIKKHIVDFANQLSSNLYIEMK